MGGARPIATRGERRPFPRTVTLLPARLFTFRTNGEVQGDRNAAPGEAAVSAQRRRDEDRWCLVFDTDASRLFVEHEQRRGDMRGRGYGTDIDEIDVTEFLHERGPGHDELIRLLSGLFEEQREAADA